MSQIDIAAPISGFINGKAVDVCLMPDPGHKEFWDKILKCQVFSAISSKFFSGEGACPCGTVLINVRLVTNHSQSMLINKERWGADHDRGINHYLAMGARSRGLGAQVDVAEVTTKRRNLIRSTASLNDWQLPTAQCSTGRER